MDVDFSWYAMSPPAIVLDRGLPAGAYKTLPADISFEILDRGDCVAGPMSYFKAVKVPLEFKTEYPDGKGCASNTVAKVSLVK